MDRPSVLRKTGPIRWSQTLLLGVLLLTAACSVSPTDSSPGIAVQPQGDPPLATHYEGVDSGHPIYEMGLHIHDPSRVVTYKGLRMIARSGSEQNGGYECGLETWWLEDEEWVPGQCLLIEKPAWTREYTPGNGGAYWAPTFGADANQIYYTASNMSDEEGGCLGLLEGEGQPPTMRWIDIGQPIACFYDSDPGDGPTTGLDPAYFESAGGDPYLVFGGGEIYVADLDPETGLIRGDPVWSEDNPSYHLVASWKNQDPIDDSEESPWMEAPFIYESDGAYFLFVNLGACCSGLQSTYEIHVGRSDQPTGPFLDRDGVDLKDGGRTLFLDREGDRLENDRYLGPGHTGIAELPDGRKAFTFHFYDRDNNGSAWIGATELVMEDGWPKALPPEEWNW